MGNSTGKIPRDKINQFIMRNQHLSRREIADKCKISPNAVTKREQDMGIKRVHKPPQKPPKTADAMIEDDRKVRALTRENRDVSAKYKTLLDEHERTLAKLHAAVEFAKPTNAIRYGPPPKGMGGEVTMVLLCSDWHIEERVDRAVVPFNEYNLEISKARSEHLFRTALKIIKAEQSKHSVRRVIVALLGDFISGDIHRDTDKSALLQPMHAIKRCQEYIVAGLTHLLEGSNIDITVVCHTGNHGRKDHEQLIANESGNSLEYLMYHNLAAYFRREKRITFMVPESYHSFIECYHLTLRFHHGHSMRYGGGVGGITIPVRKAIAQWNQMRRADIDCFGHFHSALDGNSFMANGSMIGMNAYGISIKAEFQRPTQVLFGIHSEYGKYVTNHIVFPI